MGFGLGSSRFVTRFTLCLIETRIVQQVVGGSAAIAKMVLSIFFSDNVDSFCFQRTGIVINDLGTEHSIRCKFGFWLADERALKDVTCSKGASGTKPCFCCHNVVGRSHPADGDEYLIHYTDPDVSKFDTQTLETLTEQALDLEAKHGHISAIKFALLEQCYGLTYNPHGILWDQYARNIARLRDVNKCC